MISKSSRGSDEDSRRIAQVILLYFDRVTTVAACDLEQRFHVLKNLFDLKGKLPRRRYYDSLQSLILYTKLVVNSDQKCEGFAGTCRRYQHQVIRSGGFSNNCLLHWIEV